RIERSAVGWEDESERGKGGTAVGEAVKLKVYDEIERQTEQRGNSRSREETRISETDTDECDYRRIHKKAR
ncbi:hypothetical protein, partial [Enterococcus faecium]|uniref:hypothetical protein n=1 Tax=Enterococcus faecium TaxID=1352 RepID=UPI000C02769F